MVEAVTLRFLKGACCFCCFTWDRRAVASRALGALPTAWPHAVTRTTPSAPAPSPPPPPPPPAVPPPAAAAAAAAAAASSEAASAEWSEGTAARTSATSAARLPHLCTPQQSHTKCTDSATAAAPRGFTFRSAQQHRATPHRARAKNRQAEALTAR